MVAGLRNSTAVPIVLSFYTEYQYYFCITTNCTVFVFRICTLFEKSREIKKIEIPKLPDHGRRSPEQYSSTYSSHFMLNTSTTFVLLQTVLFLYFEFVLYSRNREEFRKSKFPNFQTMVAGLRNSTAVHVVLILYKIVCSEFLTVPSLLLSSLVMA